MTNSNFWKVLLGILLLAPWGLLAQHTEIPVKQLLERQQNPHSLKVGSSASLQSVNLVPLVKGFGYASIEPTLSHAPLEFEEGAKGIMTPYIIMPPFGDMTIKGIECVVNEDVADARIVVARVRLDGMGGLWQEILVSQPTSLTKGYNQVMLNEPQSISAQDLVIVGYSCPASGIEESESAPVLYDGDQANCLPEANLVAVSNQYYEKGKAYSFNQVQHTESFELGSALIYVLVDDPKGLLDYVVYPLKQPRNSLLSSNEYFRYDLVLRNLGFKDITGMTFLENYQYGYDTREKQYPFEINIPIKGLCEVTWAHPPYPVGTSKGTVKLLNINDQSVLDKEMISWVFDAFNPSENGSTPRKSVLIETFTSESAPHAPKYNKLMDLVAGKLISEGYEVSRIAYPIGSEEVAYADEACNETIATLLGQNALPAPDDLPFFTINRAPYLAEQNAFAFVSKWKLFGESQVVDTYLLNPFLQEKERARFSEIICHDLPDGMTSIEVKGKLLLDADPADLYITAVLTEDDVKAEAQQGIGMGEEYRHQHMVRTFYTSNRGTKIMPEADGTFVYKSPEIDIYPSWKKKDLKVVLFLHRDPAYKSKISCHAYCSKTLPYGGKFTSVKTPQSSHSTIRLYQDLSGMLQIEGSYDKATVYSLEGFCVTQTLPSRLPAGGYVVVVKQTNGETTLHKVILK